MAVSLNSSLVSGVYAFVVLKQGVDAQKGDVSQQLKDSVSKRVAKYAGPDRIQVILSRVQHNQSASGDPGTAVRGSFSFSLLQFVKRLPKTRSGKIMRRVLRKIVERNLEGLGDLSTLDDPTAVQEIIQGHKELCRQTKP